MSPNEVSLGPVNNGRTSPASGRGSLRFGGQTDRRTAAVEQDDDGDVGCRSVLDVDTSIRPIDRPSGRAADVYWPAGVGDYSRSVVTDSTGQLIATISCRVSKASPEPKERLLREDTGTAFIHGLHW